MALTTLKPGGIHSDLVTAVSGSVTAVSSSLASRLTTEEVEAEGTVVSSSAQIATDISGSITSVSSSLASRIDTKGTDMTLATASIASNESNMTLATASIAAITASVSTAKTDISTNSANMTLATASIAAITASVSTAKTDISTNSANMTLATASIAAITASVSSIKTSLPTAAAISGSWQDATTATGSIGQLKVNSIDGDNIKFAYDNSANLKIIHAAGSNYSRIYMGPDNDPGIATIIFDDAQDKWQMSGHPFIFGSAGQFKEIANGAETDVPDGSGNAITVHTSGADGLWLVYCSSNTADHMGCIVFGAGYNGSRHEFGYPGSLRTAELTAVWDGDDMNVYHSQGSNQTIYYCVYQLHTS